MKLLHSKLYPSARSISNDLEKDHLNDAVKKVQSGGSTAETKAAKRARFVAKVTKAMQKLRLRQSAFTAY